MMHQQEIDSIIARVTPWPDEELIARGQFRWPGQMCAGAMGEGSGRACPGGFDRPELEDLFTPQLTYYPVSMIEWSNGKNVLHVYLEISMDKELK
jgi:hypothetical protein